MYIYCESVYSFISTLKQTCETLRKINSSVFLYFIAVDFFHSSYRRLKMSSFSLEKNRFRTIDLTVLAINVTTAFTILHYLEHVFLNGCLVQLRQ